MFGELVADGRVLSWGDNIFGSLGLGHVNMVDRPNEVEFPDDVQYIFFFWLITKDCLCCCWRETWIGFN